MYIFEFTYSYSSLSYVIDNQLDFDIHSLDWDENTNVENNDDAPENNDDSRINDNNPNIIGLDDSHNLYTLDRYLAIKLMLLYFIHSLLLMNLSLLPP